MHTFRYNPILNQWVLLGESLASTLMLKDGHTIVAGENFSVVAYPGQPFVVDYDALPKASRMKDRSEFLLHDEHPAVGEYELLISHDFPHPLSWHAAEWQQWIAQVVSRIHGAHNNPHLHFVKAFFSTSLLGTAGNAGLRVADLIFTSHPVSGQMPAITHELIEALVQKEKAFIAGNSTNFTAYVPTAPAHHKEVWLFPSTKGDSTASFADLPTVSQAELSRLLAAVMHVLMTEWEKQSWHLEIHTPMAGTEDEDSWWIQIYQSDQNVSHGLKIVESPERFAVHLHRLLAHYKATRTNG